jgi:excisionase family DNA binding protein
MSANGDVILHSTTKSDLKTLIAETFKEELTTFFSKDKKSDDRLLTRKQVAERLGISLPTLNLWTKEGIVPAVRLNSSVRYRMADVEAAMKDVKGVKHMRGRTINNS